MEYFSDSLFLLPFCTGLTLAAILPWLGLYLRLRDDWVAALGLTQVAAAGALGALPLEAPPLLGGLVAALAGAGLRQPLARLLNAPRGVVFVLLLLAGWAISVLLVANLPLAERLGHALFDGQLYFTGWSNLFWALGFAGVVGGSLHVLSPHLLRAHLFPDLERAAGGNIERAVLGFDLLVAVGLALSALSLGVMAAFALVFVPPWVAFQISRNWVRATWLSILLGVFSHVMAFALALWLDQPYGPVLALTVGALGGGLCVMAFRGPRFMLKRTP